MSRMIAGVDYDEVQQRFLAILQTHASKDAVDEAADCMRHGEGWIGIVIAAGYLTDEKVRIPADLLDDFRILAEEIGDPEDMDTYRELQAVQ